MEVVDEGTAVFATLCALTCMWLDRGLEFVFVGGIEGLRTYSCFPIVVWGEVYFEADPLTETAACDFFGVGHFV